MDGAALAFGTIIGGKYCLEEEIARGGMAAVWRAIHMDLSRPVAVKFLVSDTSTGPRDRERFLREARLAASIRHRFVVDTIDFGLTDDGQAFIVMELLEGVSVHDRVNEGETLRATELLAIVTSMLRGLAAVHAEGIVHRDLKPENVVLVEDGHDAVYPKIIDFGISRALGSDDVRPLRLTRAGLVLGTPEYMSPEQARGLADVDLRTDIYSMGVFVYECLTGVLPFQDENPGDLMVKVIMGDGAPAMSSIRPDLGEPLSRVVERAMARDREARYQTADEMREALDAATRETAETVADWADKRIGPLPARSALAPVQTDASPPPAVTSPPRTLAPTLAPRVRPLPFRHGVSVAIGCAVWLTIVGATMLTREPEEREGSDEASSSLGRKLDRGTALVSAPAPLLDQGEGPQVMTGEAKAEGLATERRGRRRSAAPSTAITAAFRDPGF